MTSVLSLRDKITGSKDISGSPKCENSSFIALVFYRTILDYILLIYSILNKKYDICKTL